AYGETARSTSRTGSLRGALKAVIKAASTIPRDMSLPLMWSAIRTSQIAQSYHPNVVHVALGRHAAGRRGRAGPFSGSEGPGLALTVPCGGTGYVGRDCDRRATRDEGRTNLPTLPGLMAMPTVLANAALSFVPDRSIAVRGPDRVAAV